MCALVDSVVKYTNNVQILIFLLSYTVVTQIKQAHGFSLCTPLSFDLNPLCGSASLPTLRIFSFYIKLQECKKNLHPRVFVSLSYILDVPSC